MSTRLDRARDLHGALTSTTPRTAAEVAGIGLPSPIPATRLNLPTISHLGTPTGRDDFHWLLTAARLLGGNAPR